MREMMDKSKGNVVVLVPETQTERRVLIKLIRDAIEGQRFEVYDRPAGNPTDRRAHFYLFDSDPDQDGWFKAVLDVDPQSEDWSEIMDSDQIRGTLGVILDGRGSPEVTFYAAGQREPWQDSLRGTLQPFLTLADFGLSPSPAGA